MDLICPDCKGALQLGLGRIAGCPLHGGEYEVLFERELDSREPTNGARAVLDGKVCDAHPRQGAVADCGTCGKALCAVCSFEVNGRHFCSDCAVSGVSAPAPSPAGQSTIQPPSIPLPVGTKFCPMCGVQAALEAYKCTACGHPFGLLNLTTPSVGSRPSAATGLKCPQHINSVAVAVCRACSAGMCETCDFLLPNGFHFCPACIDNSGNEEVSPRRKKLAITAVVIAGYCSILFLFIMSGALYRALGSPQDPQMFGCAVLIILHAPSIAGSSLAWTAYDRRFRNTPLIWTGLVWNVVILAVLAVLLVVGVVS